MKYFLIFAVCFLIAGSFTTGGKFLPRTSRGRIIAIALIIFLVLMAVWGIWAIWALAPYYLQ